MRSDKRSQNAISDSAVHKIVVTVPVAAIADILKIISTNYNLLNILFLSLNQIKLASFYRHLPYPKKKVAKCLYSYSSVSVSVSITGVMGSRFFSTGKVSNAIKWKTAWTLYKVAEPEPNFQIYFLTEDRLNTFTQIVHSLRYARVHIFAFLILTVFTHFN